MGVFTSLFLENFRNFKKAELHFSPDFNLFLGDNGSGKTNLLEAIFFLCIGKSQRNAHPRDFTAFDADYFLLKGLLASKPCPQVREASGTRSEHAFSINHSRLKSASELLGGTRVVSFDPDDILLSKGPPAERRRFLNILLSQADFNYFLSLKEYHRTLLQRNAYLKSDGRDEGYLEVLTTGLVRTGAEIRMKRGRLIRDLLPLAGTHLAALSAGEESLALELPGNAEEDSTAASLRLREEFARLERSERLFRLTLAGPHRDDLNVSLNGRPARLFASRGQLRSVSISLKLASVEYLAGNGTEKVVFLLDDIFSELDGARCEALLKRVGPGCQVFAATPRHPSFAVPQGTEFRVEDGRVEQEQ